MPVQIKIIGGDSAHWQKMTRLASDNWMFPDGIERTVTMSGWHWLTYQTVVSPDEQDHFAARCFDLAKAELIMQQKGESPYSHDLDGWIQQIIRDLIRMAWNNKQNETRANDNGIFDLEFI